MSYNYLNVLMLGDIIGNPGIKQVFLKLAELKKKEKINLVIANCENSDEGFGITEENITSFKNYGIDVLTSGNHIWSNENAADLLNKYDYVLRPGNYPNAAGKGYWIGDVGSVSVGVVNLLGRYFMIPVDCPFQTLSKLLKNELKKCSIIIVDFHAEYYQEKMTLGFDFDGHVTLICGTHTHVQTADEMILPKGTGYITDIGLCGGLDSVIGMRKEDVIEKMVNQIIIPYVPSEENCVMQGIIAKIDTVSKKTVEIKRVSV